ncbi:MAG: 50S ribosomal protein L32 [Minisyncoccales bacterium]|jgi:large subunit ribosomal protein L32
MAVPKKRTPSSRRNRRRANIFIKEPQLVKCKKCGKPTLPHTICQECGFYKGKEYINVMAKMEKKQKVNKEAEQELSTQELSKK